ncbi:MAG: PD-(D/E)XK nuclease family protein [Candidatus Competibacteraceae bacterium]
MTLKLRATAVLRYDDCPRSYWYQYVQGIQPTADSANLVFGTAIHDVCTGWLKAQAEGRALDPVATFLDVWEQVTTTRTIAYTSKLGPDDLQAMGEALVRQFPVAWKATGLVPLIGADGQPLLETRFETEIAPGLILSGSPDVVAMDAQGNIVIPDLKTASTPATDGFASVADQLTSYQVLIEAHADTLGIERVHALGFLEFLKRKPNGRTGPTIPPLLLTPARSALDLAEFRQKLVWMAEDLARNRFPKRPRLAWNSPCSFCDYAGLCQRGDWEGLVKPSVADGTL